MTEQTMLPFPLPRAHGRKGDPYTSDEALAAIARDDTLMQHIWEQARYARDNEWLFNDTWLMERVELASGKRQQRNVVARARGLLEQAGLFQRVGVRMWRNHALMHFEIHPDNPKEHPRG